MTVRRWIVTVCVVTSCGPLMTAGDALAQAAAEAPAGEVRLIDDPLETLKDSLPKTAMFTSEKAVDKLRAAFAVALERVVEIPACGELFTELDANGVEMLTTTLYTPTHPFDEQSLCESAAALTWVGGVHTRLCRRFTSLPEERAALTLIHDALHHAGLTEKPMVGLRVGRFCCDRALPGHGPDPTGEGWGVHIPGLAPARRLDLLPR